MSEPPEEKVIGKGLDAATLNPKDPQVSLHGTSHPNSPFTGNALKWGSYVYDDGTSYEGLMLEDTPHGKGVLVFGNGLGGGIQKADRGDRYEGEFTAGFASGMGQYTAVNGEVYRGEWLYGKRHGCGAVIDMSPFHKNLEAGIDPETAWEQSKDTVGKKTQYGTWQRDFFIVGPDNSGRFCHMNEIKGVLQELDSVVTRARMFQYKPDGEVTFRTAQAANGLPAPVMQDPIHYPHNTGYLAPGPMGQCFALPDDAALRTSMAKHAHNHQFIYDQYNFDLETIPGSDMEKAERLWRRKQAVIARKELRKSQLEKRRLQRLEKRTGGQRQQEPQPSNQSRPVEPAEDDDFDDDDLVADVSGLSLSASEEVAASRSVGSGSEGVRQGRFPPPTVFASLSMSMNRASHVACNALRAYAAQAPRRRCLTRPSSNKQ